MNKVITELLDSIEASMLADPDLWVIKDEFYTSRTASMPGGQVFIQQTGAIGSGNVGIPLSWFQRRRMRRAFHSLAAEKGLRGLERATDAARNS